MDTKAKYLERSVMLAEEFYEYKGWSCEILKERSASRFFKTPIKDTPAGDRVNGKSRQDHEHTSISSQEFLKKK